MPKIITLTAGIDTSKSKLDVGIEATGGYERGVARHWQDAGIEVVVLQPKQVKAFGQLHLRRAKSDRIDAFLIAACETHIRGGRERLRRALYAAALPAAFFWNPALKALYGRLTARGNGHVSASVACARKLLIYANTVVSRSTPWVDEPKPA